MKLQALPPILLAGVTIATGIFYFIIYIRRRDRRDFIFFSITCLIMGAYGILSGLSYNTDAIDAAILIQRMKFICIAVIMPTFLWFLREHSVLIRLKTFYALSFLFGICIVLGILDINGLQWLTGEEVIKTVDLPGGIRFRIVKSAYGSLGVLQLLFSFATYIYLIYRSFLMYKTGDRRKAGPLLIALGIGFLMMLNDFMVGIDLYHFVYLTEYAYLGIVSIMAMSYADEMMQISVMHKALSDITSSFLSVFQSANDAMLILQDGKIRTCNEMTYTTLGLSRKEVIGTTLDSFSSAAQPGGVLAKDLIGACIAETLRGRPQSFELVMSTPARGRFYTEIKLSTIEGQSKESVLAIIRDIDEDKRMIEVLEEYHENLEAQVKDRTARLTETIGKLEYEIQFRKKTEELLKESESRFREMTDMLPVIVFEGNAGGRINYINRAGLEITGFTREDIYSGLHPQDFVAPEDHEKLFMNIGSLITKGTVTWREYIAIKKDGTRYPVLVQVSIFYLDGRNRGMRGVVVDLTEIRRAERMRQKSEKRFRDLVNQLPDIVYETDTEGIIRYTNRIGSELTGYSLQDIDAGLRIDRIIAPEEHERLWDNFKRAMAGERFITSEYTAIKKDGARFPIVAHSSPILDETGAVTGIRGVIIDITMEKNAEELLRASEKRFRDLADLLPAIIYETDRKGNILYVNDHAIELTGYSREEFDRGIHISAFFSTDDYRRLTLDTQDLLTMGRINPVEYELIRSDGSMVHVLISNSIIYESGIPSGFRGVVTDVTEIKEIQRQIIEAMNAAKAANHAKSAFIANISHELKTPLNSILGYCRLLEMQRIGAINSKQMEYIRSIDESGHHLLDIIQELLDISKIHAGTMKMERASIDLSKLLTRSVAAIMPLAVEKRLVVESSIDRNLGLVRGDATRLRQVVSNLFSNAIKFTGEGTSIGIIASKKEKSAEITVWDQGPGIPREHWDRIFEPFEQVSVDEAVKNQGAGLGLAITKKIIDFHGGSIIVHSIEGSGSEFTVTLPIIE
ncbi:MAG: PAS domain S-box protein [Spirochaetes bacterium]|nr:PAS domain S-box protein [Spirochaetota bacterium]